MLIRLYVRIPYSILEPSTPAFIYFETLKKKNCCESTRLKAFANQVKMRPKRGGKKRGTKENFKRLDETSSKREFPSAPSSLLSQILLDTPKSCCLPNWRAAPSRVFDLARHHYDAPNWYRFVPYRCKSRWNIWSVLPVPWRCSCLPAISVPGAKNKHPR